MLTLDFETRSEAELPKVGAARYASDESARILLYSVSKDGGEPLTWFPSSFLLRYAPKRRAEAKEAKALLVNAFETGEEIYCHNILFELFMLKYRREIDLEIKVKPKLNQFRCSQVLCYKAGLPPSLEKACEALELSNQKYGRGKQLINMFSKPEFVQPHDDPEAFLEFGRYCTLDVKAEYELIQALRSFWLRGAELQTFQADLKMNLRGIPVNKTALLHASALIAEEENRLVNEFRKLTGGLNPTQVAKVTEWLRERGYPFKTLGVEFVKQALASETWENRKAKKALLIRYNIAFSAAKKVQTMLDCACPDNRVRGSLQFYGAQATGRWAGRLIQPQNFKRPTIKEVERAFLAIESGMSAEEIELTFGMTLEVISSCIRNFVSYEKTSDN